MRRDNPALGALSVVLAALAFAIMSALIRELSATLPSPVIVFFRNFFGLLFLIPWLIRLRPSGLRTDYPLLHLLRVTAGLMAMYCFFWAIPRLHLSEAVLLNYATPLFIPFIAWFWLRERVATPVRWAIVIGFVGITLILRPGTGLFTGAGGVGLMAGMFAAVSMVTIRRMGGTEPATRIVFYFAVFGTLISFLPLLWYWQPLDLREGLLLAAVGLTATLGQLLITKGYTLAPAAQVGPFTYAAVVFAGLIGWALWDETPGLISVAGMTLVAVAGILALRRQAGRVPSRRATPFGIDGKQPAKKR